MEVHAVALLRACVENEAESPGSWTEEQVIEGGKEIERDPRTYGQRKHTGTRTVNAEDTSGARDRAKDTNICIFKNKYRILERLQPTRPARRMPMLVRQRTQGIQWRYCRKHTGVPRMTEEKRSVLV